jgi:tetratricopeptide (TPR) repeat protein
MDSEATQSSGSVAFLAWVEVNKKRLLMGGVLLVLAILAISFIWLQRSHREQKASEALSDVRLPVNPASPIPAGAAEDLMKVATEYKGTKAAARALLTSAGVLFAQKKYAEAEARFAQVAQEYPESPWGPESLLGIAASLEAQGKKAEAIAKYEELTRRFAKAAVVEDGKLALARLYEAQKPEEAFKLYEELTKLGQGSAVAMEAAMRQDTLLKARPELAKLREQPPIAPQVTPAPPPIQLKPGSNAPGSSPPVKIDLQPPPASPAPTPAAPVPAPAPAPPSVPTPGAPNK